MELGTAEEKTRELKTKQQKIYKLKGEERHKKQKTLKTYGRVSEEVPRQRGSRWALKLPPPHLDTTRSTFKYFEQLGREWEE